MVSESAYERGARHEREGGAAGSGGSSNVGGSRGGGMAFLSKPLGPLPLWVWLVLGLFAALGYYVWAKHNSATTTAASSTNTSTGTTTTDSSLIPQFVNQVYTQGTPPEAPLTTASGTGSTSGGTTTSGGSTTGGSGTTTTSTGTGGNSSTTNSSMVIPNVNGLYADQAIQVLKSAGFDPQITLTSASNHPGIWHIITKTQPAEGSSAAKGSIIKLYYKDSKTA